MNSSVSEDPFRYAAETLLSFLSRFEEQAAGIAPGTAFEDIPDDWVCLVGGVGKADFVPYED